jgi:hypothetical protein
MNPNHDSQGKFASGSGGPGLAKAQAAKALTEKHSAELADKIDKMSVGGGRGLNPAMVANLTKWANSIHQPGATVLRMPKHKMDQHIKNVMRAFPLKKK